MHSNAPESDEDPELTTPQLSQEDDPEASAYFPASHGTHEAWPVAPCADPGAHAVQSELPGVEAWNPAEHAVHDADLSDGATKPVEQFVHNAWPEVLIFPDWQDVQSELRPVE